MSNAFPTPPSAVPKSRGWLAFFGVLSILIGLFAIAWPLAMTVAIEQVIGIVLVVSGVFAIGAVAFGEEKNHRVATVVLALIRLVTGLLLLLYIKPGVLAITAVLGAFSLRKARCASSRPSRCGGIRHGFSSCSTVCWPSCSAA